MGGGLMQLVAYGAQDIYLTGNPQITFFKVVYRRHTNFSIESIEQTFNGNVELGSKLTCTVSRNGDLVHKLYLQADVTQISGGNGNLWWTNGLGNALIKTVDLEIGGQLIEKHYSEWLDIWGELTVKSEHRNYYDKMVGNYNSQTGLKHNNNLSTRRFYIPLQFWFCRNPGLALPIIALQYHEVKIHIEFTDLYSLIKNDGSNFTSGLTGGILSASIFADYIYLDTDERRRFAQVSHEYLIEQVQFNNNDLITANKTLHNATLNFNHPIKCLYWVIVPESLSEKNTLTGNNPFRYSLTETSETETFKNMKIQLNGHDRFAERDADYFRLVQNYQHHNTCPRKHIYSYSFALKPDEHQPSGTCNFSRIDNSVMLFNFNASMPRSHLKVFSVNYNVLRIMSGMGGLAYSN